MSQTIETLTVSNFKGIRGEVTLHPSGESLIVLSGDNGQGKSSFIDGIRELFDPQGVKETGLPINTDADGNAYVEYTTATVRARRTWTEQNSAGKLQVWERDSTGAEKVSSVSPKAFILAATGGAIFDADSFIKLAEKEQRAKLLERVELPFDLDQLAIDRQKAYDARRDAKKAVDTQAAQVAGMPPIDKSLPFEETPSATILAELDEARARNAAVKELGAASVRASDARFAARAEVLRLVRELANAEVVLAATQAAEVNAIDTAAQGVFIDEQPLVDKLAAADTTNAKVRAQHARLQAEATLNQNRTEHAALEAAIAEIDKTKADGLAAAEFPIPGLSVDDEGITVFGIPFRQLNDAEKAQVAFDLASAAQPEVRLFWMKQGDLLDRNSLKKVAEKAATRGYTLLMERDRDESRQLFGATFTEGQASINTGAVAE